MSSQSSTRKIAEKIAVINDRSVFLGFDVYMTLELLCKTPQQWMDADVCLLYTSPSPRDRG